MVIVDSHAHLYFDRFDPDRAQVFERARAAGVVAFVTVGTDAISSKACFDLSSEHRDVFPTAGIHPNDSAKVSEADWAVIEALAAEPRCVAVGETGLDYYRDWAPKDTQRAAFARQIALARRHAKPVIIHCREAFADVYQTLAECGGSPGVMHCFSGGPGDAERALDLGLFVSFAGPLTYKKNAELRSVLAMTPRDRILVETDCPFLPPEGQRGKRNEPAFLQALLEVVGETLGMSAEAAGRLTSENAKRLFALPILG